MPAAADTGTLLPDNALEIVAALMLALVVAGALAIMAGRLMQRFLRRIEGDGPPSHMARAAVRVVRAMTFIIVVALVAFPALDMAGVGMAVGLEGEDLTRWLGRTGLRIGVILLLTTAASRLVTALVGRAEREVVAGRSVRDLERLKRAQTIGRTSRGFLTSIIWLTGLLMILQALDINIMPVLTGAGIVGLAVGFGAQTLVKDMIAGFFMLIEDQVRVGDVAVLNGTGGLVEQINLRTTVLRDLEGVVYVIPNGEIKTLANRTKDFSYAVLELSVDYDTDVDAAIAAIVRAGEAVRQDPALAASILEPLEVLGVDDLRGPAVTIKVRFKTVPLQQWTIARAFRRRIKEAFDADGIRMPAQRVAVTPDSGNAAAAPAAASSLPRSIA